MSTLTATSPAKGEQINVVTGSAMDTYNANRRAGMSAAELTADDIAMLARRVRYLADRAEHNQKIDFNIRQDDMARVEMLEQRVASLEQKLAEALSANESLSSIAASLASLSKTIPGR